jgi:hypothetical protein
VLEALRSEKRRGREKANRKLEVREETAKAMREKATTDKKWIGGKIFPESQKQRRICMNKANWSWNREIRDCFHFDIFAVC